MSNLNPAPHFGLVLDCADPERLAESWAAALGYANVGSAGVYVALYPRQGTGPKLLLQRVTEGNEFCICHNGSPTIHEKI